MAQQPINMNQIRRIIQLLQQGASNRRIAKECSVSRRTVRKYKERVQQRGIAYEQLLELEDRQLDALVYEPPETGKERILRYDELQEELKRAAVELNKTGVTRQLLWQEYRGKHPEGYSYTQYCTYLRRTLTDKEAVMHFLPRMGEKLMVDYAGKTITYQSEGEGEVKCQVFVAVLPYSGYSYVEALRSQSQQDFISALENALVYMGGVPRCIVGDNLKAYVKRSNRYEPEFTDLAEQFSVHYNTALMATRIRKPRDKGAVEKTVELAYQRVYAPLRHHTFGSLEELNAAFRIQLEAHHNRPFRAQEQTRKQWYEEEKLQLLPLPSSRLELKRHLTAKVQRNYHVLMGEDRHFYSVPYAYIGKLVQLVCTATMVEIYSDHKRIAVHSRSPRRNGYSTIADHMPSHHKHYERTLGWDGDYFKNEAQKIAPPVREVMEYMLTSRPFCEQAYNACRGILRLANKFGKERLTAACTMALAARAISYRFIHNILEHNMDLRQSPPSLFNLPAEHENIRGAQHYQ